MPGGYVHLSNSGCLLPLLIVVNLFFGRLFFTSTAWWLGFELLLILIFIFKVRSMLANMRRLFEAQADHPGHRRPQGKVIDIQAQEVKDKQELE